jgi:hypothetical protein
MSVPAQSSTPVQLNEELIIVAARTVDIDTVRVVGVTCVRKAAVNTSSYILLHFSMSWYKGHLRGEDLK